MGTSIKISVSVNALITTHNDTSGLILVQLARPENKRDLWSLPGGKVDEGESLMDALHREIFEETGITPNLYNSKKLAILHDKPETTCKHIFHLQLHSQPVFSFNVEEILQVAWKRTDLSLNKLQFRAPWVLPLIFDFVSGNLCENRLYSQENR